MQSRLFRSAILVGCLALPSGCLMLDSAQEMSRQTLRIFKPRETDYRDMTEEKGDEFAFVGKLGRGNRPRERDPDPWFKKYLMSEKARNIEHNLGVD